MNPLQLYIYRLGCGKVKDQLCTSSVYSCCVSRSVAAVYLSISAHSAVMYNQATSHTTVLYYQATSLSQPILLSCIIRPPLYLSPYYCSVLSGHLYIYCCPALSGHLSISAHTTVLYYQVYLLMSCMIRPPLYLSPYCCPA